MRRVVARGVRACKRRAWRLADPVRPRPRVCVYMQASGARAMCVCARGQGGRGAGRPCLTGPDVCGCICVHACVRVYAGVVCACWSSACAECVCALVVPRALVSANVSMCVWARGQGGSAVARARQRPCPRLLRCMYICMCVHACVRVGGRGQGTSLVRVCSLPPPQFSYGQDARECIMCE